MLAGHEGFGLAALPVRAVRVLGLGIRRDPTPEEPAHAVTIGPKSRKTHRQLRDAAQWVCHSPDWADLQLLSQVIRLVPARNASRLRHLPSTACGLSAHHAEAYVLPPGRGLLWQPVG